MYCPVCGAESTQGLNYCKRCGAGLGGSSPPIEPRTSFGRMMGMLLPVAAVSLGGFIALFSTVYNLGERTGFDTRALIAIMAFGGATVVCVIGLLVWLLLQLTTGFSPKFTAEKKERLSPREHSPYELPPSQGSVPSVTENTTRNFDPAIYRDKGIQE